MPGATGQTKKCQSRAVNRFWPWQQLDRGTGAAVQISTRASVSRFRKRVEGRPARRSLASGNQSLTLTNQQGSFGNSASRVLAAEGRKPASADAWRLTLRRMQPIAGQGFPGPGHSGHPPGSHLTLLDITSIGRHSLSERSRIRVIIGQKSLTLSIRVSAATAAAAVVLVRLHAGAGVASD